MRFDGLMLKSKILSVGFIRVILVVILAVAAVVGFRSLIREFDLTERTDRMARQAAQVEVSAANLTSSLYQYLLTGEARYREVCLQQEKSLEKDVARLKPMAGADASQARLVVGVEEALNGWKTHIVTPVMQGKQSVGTDGQKQAAAGLARGDGLLIDSKRY
jgi:CHASE3 domain sensor protein